LSEPITFLSIHFDAALRIRRKPANWFEALFLEFHAKANEIDALPMRSFAWL
jgi:hypothetical protein